MISLPCPWLSSLLFHDLSHDLPTTPVALITHRSWSLSWSPCHTHGSHHSSLMIFLLGSWPLSWSPYHAHGSHHSSLMIFLLGSWFLSLYLSARLMISLPCSRSLCYPSSPAPRVAKRCPLPLWFSLPLHRQWISFSLKLMHDMFVICYSLY